MAKYAGTHPKFKALEEEKPDVGEGYENTPWDNSWDRMAAEVEAYMEILEDAPEPERVSDSPFKSVEGPLYGGEVVAFQIADGHALYVVADTSPLTLWHVPKGDGYQIRGAHLRGLRKQDVKPKRVNPERALKHAENHLERMRERAEEREQTVSR